MHANRSPTNLLLLLLLLFPPPSSSDPDEGDKGLKYTQKKRDFSPSTDRRNKMRRETNAAFAWRSNLGNEGRD